MPADGPPVPSKCRARGPGPPTEDRTERTDALGDGLGACGGAVSAGAGLGETGRGDASCQPGAWAKGVTPTRRHQPIPCVGRRGRCGGARTTAGNQGATAQEATAPRSTRPSVPIPASRARPRWGRSVRAQWPCGLGKSNRGPAADDPARRRMKGSRGRDGDGGERPGGREARSRRKLGGIAGGDAATRPTTFGLASAHGGARSTRAGRRGAGAGLRGGGGR